jgi:hypothetical protein
MKSFSSCPPESRPTGLRNASRATPTISATACASAAFPQPLLAEGLHEPRGALSRPSGD